MRSASARPAANTVVMPVARPSRSASRPCGSSKRSQSSTATSTSCSGATSRSTVAPYRSTSGELGVGQITWTVAPGWASRQASINLIIAELRPDRGGPMTSTCSPIGTCSVAGDSVTKSRPTGRSTTGPTCAPRRPSVSAGTNRGSTSTVSGPPSPSSGSRSSSATCASSPVAATTSRPGIAGGTRVGRHTERRSVARVGEVEHPALGEPRQRGTTSACGGRRRRSWRCPHPVRRRARDRAPSMTIPVRRVRGTRAARSTRRSPPRCRVRGRWPTRNGGGRARRRAGARGGRRAPPRARGSRRGNALL